MARVKTFILHEELGLNDTYVATWITECEVEHYVTVTATFLPYPSPRVTIVVTKLDEKEPLV